MAGPALALFLKRINIDAVIYEATSNFSDDKGLFLGITPNGLNVLNEIVSVEELYSDHTPGKIRFYNHQNKAIGLFDTAGQKAMYGFETIQLKRGLLNRAIRGEAIRKGIPINTGKKLKSLVQERSTVTVEFEDGSLDTGDILIGCDGIHSAVRNALFPGEAPMIYTGLLSSGGYAEMKTDTLNKEAITMIFGKKAFFSYAISNKNEVWWFNNIYQKDEPERSELNSSEANVIKLKLSRLHQGDPEVIAQILQATDRIEIYSIYDIPFLKNWYNGNVCLIGDAAHATSPHIGQGASMALEDAMMLARSLRDVVDIQKAFEAFQSSRKERVEQVIKKARKIGNEKTPGFFQQWFRDMFLRYFLKIEAKKMDWIYGYKQNWKDKIASSQ